MEATALKRPIGYLRHNGGELAIGVACVVAAGMLTNAADDPSHDSRVEGKANESIALSHTGQSLTVTSVELGKAVKTATDEPSTSGGLFLVVKLVTRTPNDQLVDALSCTLEQGGVESQSLGGAQVMVPAPGMKVAQAMVFERAPGQIAGAKLLCRPSETIVAFRPSFAVDLMLGEQQERAGLQRTKPIEYDRNFEFSVI